MENLKVYQENIDQANDIVLANLQKHVNETIIRKKVINSYLDFLKVDLDGYENRSEKFTSNSLEEYTYTADFFKRAQDKKATKILMKIAATVSNNSVSIHLTTTSEKEFYSIYEKRWNKEVKDIVANFIVDGENILVITGEKNQSTIVIGSGNEKYPIVPVKTIFDICPLQMMVIKACPNYKLSNGISDKDYLIHRQMISMKQLQKKI